MSNITVQCYVTNERDLIDFRFQSETGEPITPQQLIDAISDYLLLDPNSLFSQDG